MILSALIRRKGSRGSSVNTATGPAPATVLVSSAVGGNDQITVTWAAPTTKIDQSSLPSGDISHYIYRRYNLTNTELVETNVGNVTTYTETGVTPTGDYEVTIACVSAYDEGFESPRFFVTVT